jgi:NodT family efflux transporter outer membrane factor (OMF) lipoprotein
VHGVHHVREDRVEDRARFLRIAVGDQFLRALEIGEQHGHVFALAVESTLGGQDLLGEVFGVLLPAAIDVSWTPDLWGKIRRTVESNQAGAQGSAGDLENARLSFHAQLAEDFFLFHTLDAQRAFLDTTVAGYEKFLQMTRNRYASGVASRADVVQAETQLETTRAQAIDVGVQRAQTEHAIALLVGEPASTFSLPVTPLAATPPSIPIGVPSELLQRRPDIAAAEARRSGQRSDRRRHLRVLPHAHTECLDRFQSSGLSTFLSAPSHFWSVGPSISQTVLDGFRGAQTAFARAAYDASVATYRQTVLAAFQDVEDNLAALRILEDEARVQAEAVRASQESLRVTTDQYLAVVVSYLNVITVQTTALSNEIVAIQIQGRRMSAAVQLIQALGGGWRASDLPSTKAVTR